MVTESDRIKIKSEIQKHFPNCFEFIIESLTADDYENLVSAGGNEENFRRFIHRKIAKLELQIDENCQAQTNRTKTVINDKLRKLYPNDDEKSGRICWYINKHSLWYALVDNTEELLEEIHDVVYKDQKVINEYQHDNYLIDKMKKKTSRAAIIDDELFRWFTIFKFVSCLTSGPNHLCNYALFIINSMNILRHQCSSNHRSDTMKRCLHIGSRFFILCSGFFGSFAGSKIGIGCQAPYYGEFVCDVFGGVFMYTMSYMVLQKFNLLRNDHVDGNDLKLALDYFGL